MMKNIGAIVKSADSYMDCGDYEKAIAQYDLLTSHFPDNPRYYALRGYCYSKRQQFANALRDYSTALSLKPDAPSTLFNRGRIYFAMGEYELALADYLKSAKLSPKWDVFLNIGFIYRCRHEFEQARQFFRKALLKDCDNTSVYHELLSLMRIIGQRSLLRTVPAACFNGSSEIRKSIRKAQRLIRYGACEEALSLYHELVTRDPRNARLHILRGCCYFYMESYESALKDFSMAAAMAPENPAAWINQARVYMKTKQAAMAIRMLKKAHELEEAWDIWYLLGIVREDNCEWNQARLCYWKALERAPERKFLHVALRRLMRRIRLTSGLRIVKITNTGDGDAATVIRKAASLMMEGNCEAALDYYDILIDRFPQCRLRYEMRGCCFYFMEEYEKACKDFSAQLKLTPRRASTWFNRAQAYAALERFAEALSDLDASEKILPKSDIVLTRDTIYEYQKKRPENKNL